MSSKTKGKEVILSAEAGLTSIVQSSGLSNSGVNRKVHAGFVLSGRAAFCKCDLYPGQQFPLMFRRPMKVKCFQLSSAGAVRDHNEDFVAFWEPEDFDCRQDIGSIAILADGVGGDGQRRHREPHGGGNRAGRFSRKPNRKPRPRTIVREIYDEASRQGFSGIAQKQGRMSTTLLDLHFSRTTR